MVIPKPSELKDFSKFEDAALIKLIAAKQPEALEVLYKRHGRSIYHLALMTCGRAALAEEVTMAVFLQAWEKAGDTLKAPEKASAWLFEIERSCAAVVGQSGETPSTAGEVIPEELPPAQEDPPANLKSRLMREVKKRKSNLQGPMQHVAA
jgi:RNA polymerase sigma-70 factor (ECF subfamily)